MTSSAIVPISLPLTTGAGTMSTITVYANSATSLDHRLELFGAIVAIGIQFMVTGTSTILEQIPLRV